MSFQDKRKFVERVMTDVVVKIEDEEDEQTAALFHAAGILLIGCWTELHTMNKELSAIASRLRA